MADVKPYVFISHATQDQDVADWLVDELKKARVNIWIADDRIADGVFARMIETAVKDCGAMIVIMSKKAGNSEWVLSEFLFAAKLNKRIFIAHIDDSILPIYAIARNAISFEGSKRSGGLKRLLRALDRTNLQQPLPEPTTPRQKRMLDPSTNKLNFFKYLKQLPGGDDIERVALEIYRWARSEKLATEFSGTAIPSLHTRLEIKGDEVIVVSVLGFSRQPSVQIPLQNLRDLSPYDDPEFRISTLEALNRFLPEGKKLPDDRADALPRLPLSALASSKDDLKVFKEILQEIVDNLRS